MGCYICQQPLTNQEIDAYFEHNHTPGDEQPPLCGKASCANKYKKRYRRSEEEEFSQRRKDMLPSDRKRMENDLIREGRARKGDIKGYKKYRNSLSTIVREMCDAIKNRDHRRFRCILYRHKNCLRELYSKRGNSKGDCVEWARDLIYNKYTGIIVAKFVEEFNLSKDFSSEIESYVICNLDQVDFIIENGVIPSYNFGMIPTKHHVYKYLKPYNFKVTGEEYEAPSSLPPPSPLDLLQQ